MLQQKPTKKQIRSLAYLLSGAFPQSSIRGFIYDCLQEKYIKRDFRPISVMDAFDQMLTFAFAAASYRCYNKKDLIGKKFIDTYNIANRVFSRARFVEAIDTFGLHTLEKPPKSYVVQISKTNSGSCLDKDIVLVQYPLKNHKPFAFYLKRPQLLNTIFNAETLMQLLQAMKYAGLWDVTGENIWVNTKTNKVTYIDFEPKNDILPHEIFNKSAYRCRLNTCYLMLEFLKRFATGTVQRAAVCDFMIKNPDIDLDWYRKECLKSHKTYFNTGFEFEEKLTSSSRTTIALGPLGRLMYYYDPMSNLCVALRKQVRDQISNTY